MKPIMMITADMIMIKKIIRTGALGLGFLLLFGCKSESSLRAEHIVEKAVEAMQKGAVDFIQKPFRDQELLDRIREALATDEERREQQQHHAEVASRLNRLTNREREVFDLVVTGKPNKVIAYELGVSQRTVEIHRARVMEKMQARSLADLVRMHMTA